MRGGLRRDVLWRAAHGAAVVCAGGAWAGRAAGVRRATALCSGVCRRRELFEGGITGGGEGGVPGAHTSSR